MEHTLTGHGRSPGPSTGGAAEPDPLVGTVLDGKYAIEAVLGAGGMGTVYRARHVGLGTVRAVKLMKPELARDPSFTTRFEREARLLAKVRHPHLVALHDFSRLASGACYMVSEYVEGETLAAWLKRHPAADDEEIARLFRQMAEALEAAHTMGVVHRDVSPDNVMVGDGPGGLSAKILDFGLAKDVMRGSPGLTGAGLLLGKVGYASPEQMGLLEDDEDVDARSDVFSLAAVLYRLRCGVLPWRSDSLQAYLHDLIVRPEEEWIERIEAEAPPAWRPLFRCALARNRDERYASMAAFKEAVEQVARGGTAPVTTAPKRPASRPRWLAAAVVVGLLGIGAAWSWLPKRDAPPSAVPVPTAEQAVPPPVVSPAAETRSAIRDEPPPTTTAAPSRAPQSAPRPSESPVGRSAVALATPRAEPAPTNAPAIDVAAEGSITVTSDPEAAVHIDGQPRGHTPAILAVAPGRHTLRLTSADGQSFEETIDVGPGERLTRDRRFPGVGSLAIAAEPWMEVRVDGGAPEQTPFLIASIAAGPHVVTARRAGYRPITREIQVQRGQTTTVRLVGEREAERSDIERRSDSETPAGAPRP